ncbi:hypothetical protein JCM19046_3542 [Bacillus sp. JCM 19046]|nr:hypothetical protein JCM19046_3542 [Bacillus sp. JCM 19046]
MKEIKFRAWYESPIRKKMIYEGATGECFQLEREGQPITIMQYTGLKDKNGTEIYEGDILDAQSDSVQIVCWDENQARYKSVPLYAYKTNAGNGGWSGYDLFNRKLEVIGNIHQHPELLNN